MNNIVGISTGRIAGIQFVQNEFIIKFETDNGVFDFLHCKEDDRQLQSLSKLFNLEASNFLTQLVGKRVTLIFGPILFINSKAAMLYGFGKENGDMFIIPEYLFGIACQEMKKEFYNRNEVLDLLEVVEEYL